MFAIPALALCAAASPVGASADEAPAASEVRRLREELDAERRARAAERADLERRLVALEKERRGGPTQDEIAASVEAYLHDKEGFEAEPHAGERPDAADPHGTHGHGARVDLDVAVYLSARFGASGATDAALSSIELGDHDPRVRGANVRNEELVLSAEVAGCFTGFLDVVSLIDEDGETRVELEEAFGSTSALPFGAELRFGQFLTEFGRTNREHPHEWEFHDVPVVLGRVFGADGLRGQGMRLAWDVPLRSRRGLRLLAGWQNARGETQAPFLGEEGATIGEHEFVRRDVARLSDLSWHGRVEVASDAARCRACAGPVTWLAGISAAVGPNGTGPDGTTHVLGADFAWTWRPQGPGVCRPWLEWRTEAVWRGFHADRQTRLVDDGAGGTTSLFVGARDYEDWGVTSQVVLGFRPGWSVGGRLDWADSDGAFDGAHFRASLSLTHHRSESARVRLQVQYDHVDGLSRAFPGDDDGNVSFWLGFDLALGAHHAHDF